jgi:hypothetical protein
MSGVLRLLAAMEGGNLSAVKRLVAAGASVTERDGDSSFNAILYASFEGHIAIVKYLLEEGASITVKTKYGWTPLILALKQRHYALAKYLLLETETSIGDSMGHYNVWHAFDTTGTDDVEMTSLLKVMVMLEDAPPAFIGKLTRADREIVTRGRAFRAQLPLYLEEQRALVVSHCTLPDVLRPLIAAYAATTPEEMWADGLRIRARRPKRTKLEMEADGEASTPLRRSLRLRQKRA